MIFLLPRLATLSSCFRLPFSAYCSDKEGILDVRSLHPYLVEILVTWSYHFLLEPSSALAPIIQYHTWNFPASWPLMGDDPFTGILHFYPSSCDISLRLWSYGLLLIAFMYASLCLLQVISAIIHASVVTCRCNSAGYA